MPVTLRKVIQVTLLISLAAGGLGLFYLETILSQSASVNVDDGLRREISDFNSMMNSIDGQISQLQLVDSNGGTGQTSTVQNQTRPQSSSIIDYAQLAAPTLEGTLLQLGRERAQLQSMLGQTADANLKGGFLYSSTLSYQIVGGVYANTGLRTAYSASVMFIFYSRPNGQGAALCTLTYPLGNIPAGGIVSVGRLQCGIGSVAAESVSFQFEWST